MLSDRSRARFLARSSVLMIALLALWWFVLVNPLLLLLRGSAAILGSLAYGVSYSKLITETATGDWSFSIPWELEVPKSRQQPDPTKIQSIEFDLARTDAIAFTFSLPLYWAIALAASPTRRGVRPLVWGTILMVILETLLLLAFVEIDACNIAAHLARSQSDIGKWFLNFGNYLVVNVIPYVSPFVVAISLDRDLRRQIFGWGNKEPFLAGGTRPSVASAADHRRPSKRSRRGLRTAR